MHASVSQIFPTFSMEFEGYVHWMYLDVLGLVTTGVGNLIDSVPAAVALPFKDKAGNKASAAQISAEWTKLKAMKELAKKGHRACEAVTELRLTDADIDALVRQRLALNEAHLVTVFPDWATWPADAQLAVHSMSWAMGPAFSPQWPKFTAACRARDWSAAAADCRMREVSKTGVPNPGVVPRNNANQRCLNNAHAVEAQGLPLNELIYPSAR